MNTQKREYAAQDIPEFDEAEKQLAANGLDVKATRSIDLIDEFFQNHRNLPVTVANIYRAVEERKNEFVWFSPAELEYRRIAAENPAAAQQLANWMRTTQGKPGTLNNSGDQYFVNMSSLLPVLRGYEINATTISHAIDRVQSRPNQLSYVPEPRRTEPKSRAALADPTDSSHWLGDMVADGRGGFRNKTPHEQKADREAKEAAEAVSRTTNVSTQVREAKRLAEEIRGSTHSESDQLQRILVTTPGTSEVNWPETLAARQRMAKQFENHRAVSRFIR